MKMAPNMGLIKLIVATLAVVFFSGCASITGTTGQSVSVDTRLKDKQVAGASCELTNSRGKWFVTTPGSVQIRRSNEDLIVQCTKESMESGRASVVSDTKGSMFGNIIIGGGIGAIVDHSNGSAYEYPTLIQIMMGETVTVRTTPETAASQNPQSIPPASSDQQPTLQQASNNLLPNPTSRLEQLDSLRQKGLISQVDYDAKKSEILKNL